MIPEVKKDRDYRSHHCKRAHKTRKKARDAIRKMKRKPGRKGRLVEYQCHVCGQWHVGNVSKNAS